MSFVFYIFWVTVLIFLSHPFPCLQMLFFSFSFYHISLLIFPLYSRLSRLLSFSCRLLTFMFVPLIMVLFLSYFPFMVWFTLCKSFPSLSILYLIFPFSYFLPLASGFFAPSLPSFPVPSFFFFVSIYLPLFCLFSPHVLLSPLLSFFCQVLAFPRRSPVGSCSLRMPRLSVRPRLT